MNINQDISETRLQLRQLFESDRMLGIRDIPLTGEIVRRICEHTSGTPVDDVSSSMNLKQKQEQLDTIDRTRVKVCERCDLCQTRTKTVFGQGHASARLVFVGEGPGHDEDQQGLAFVGRAGQLLTRMIQAMGLSRDEVYITNVVKCRPPQNRTPTQQEIGACSPYLFEQLNIIKPEVICALGAPAAQTLLNTTDGIGRLRGRFHDFNLSQHHGETTNVPLMPTYHPAYLLRSPGEKKKAWDDLRMIMQLLELPLPST